MPDSPYSKGSRRHKIHRFPDDTPFDVQRQIADLDYLTSSRAAMTFRATVTRALRTASHGPSCAS